MKPFLRAILLQNLEYWNMGMMGFKKRGIKEQVTALILSSLWNILKLKRRKPMSGEHH